METTRNTLKAAMAALSAMAVALVAVILVSVHPVFASAAEEPVQGVAEGNISLSVPATTLPCALTADGTVITPDADKYAFVNTGSVAVSIASPEVKLSNGVHDVNMSAKAAVVATTDKNQFKKLFDESDKQIDWILNNQGQGEQTLMQGQSLCVKFGIDPLTYDKNANVIVQAATSGGCNIASVNYAYKESRMPAYAVFFDNGKTAKLYKGYDRPVKGQPYRGSAEPVFDFVDDIENDKAEVFVPYKDVLERVSVETEDGEIQPTTTKGWFTRCRKLAGVEGLSKLDTSKVTDMSDMFSSCRGLTSLDVSNFNTSKVTDMSWMFIGCSGLTSLDVSNFNTGKVTNMQGMFQVCRGLKSLDVSGFDTGNVTKMSNMFEGCSGLTTLDVSGFDTAKVTSMSHMFEGCSGLTTLDVSKFDTSKVTSMSWMFSRCSGLTSLDLSNFDTSKVTGMGNMFDGCRGLTSLDLSKFDTASVTNMSYMFDYCSGLTSLDVSKFDTGKVTDMSMMFRGCTGLASLDLSGFDTGKVTDMSMMFRGCTGLASLDLSGFDTGKVTNMSMMFDYCSGLEQVTLRGGWSRPFADCSLPKTMYVKDGNGSFAEYTGGFPTTKTDTYYTENGIKQAFAVVYDDGNGGRAAKLYNRAKVPAAGDTFEGVAVTEVITGIENKPGAFEDKDGGKKLTKVEVVDDGIQPLTMSGWFSGCTSLSEIEGLKKLDTFNVTDMGYMFLYCWSLTSLDLSSFNTGNATNTASMFYSCSSLKQVTLKEGWCSSFRVCGLASKMYVKDGNGSFAEYTGGFPTTKTDTYYTENGIKQAFAVVYDDGNGGRAAKLYNRAKVPAAGDTFEGVAVTEVITGIENKPGAFQDKGGGKKLTKVEVVDYGIQPLTTKKWFSGCSKLASVEGLSKLDTSKATDMSGMFSSCGGLTSLDVSKFDTAKVTDMSFMFQGCSGVTLLDVSKFDTAKVTNMSSMFGYCRGLKSLNLSSFDTAKVMYMDYMFYECSGLTSLNLSSFDTAKVVYMGYMFEQCNKLNTVTFPNDAASKTQLKKALSDCGITPRSNQRTIDEDANALSASDNMESHQCEEGVEHRNLQYVGAAPLSGSTASAAANAPSSNVGSAGKTEADSPGQFGGSESKEPSAEKADNRQPDSDGNLSSDKSGSSAHMK